jgi:hypothetical protein
MKARHRRIPVGPLLRHRGRHGPPFRLGRFIAITAILAVLPVAVGWASHTSASRRGAGLRPPRGSPGGRPAQTAATPSAPATSPATSPIAQSHAAPAWRANWVVQENRLPGTRAWRLSASPPGTSIEGFADRVSAERGEQVVLRVSTTAPAFHVEVYRLGYYQGLGGRLLWRSQAVRAAPQPGPTIDPVTNMVQAPWAPSFSFVVGSDWTPGQYVLKLVASDRSQSWVPLTVRDDSSHAALVIQSSVTTWQAYNAWGGYSLYHGPSGGGFDRATVVSFDRPYAIGHGAGDLLDGNEQPVTALVERLGMDVTYWTDVDFHARPGLLLNHRALITLGHDEYWSLAMRNGALLARDHGVNLAFLGANADFRHIRLAPSRLGLDREEINYRSNPDPLEGIDDADVTANWRSGPVPRPESALNGAIYECNPASADMVITDAGSWLCR